jgi:RNA polymerase-interacting CarD/CdnL/TRCF family regulator
MSSQEESLSKGDWIVHAHYGVGQVKRKEKKVLEGDKKTFFRVKTFNGVYWLPVKNTAVPHIRRLASEYQIRKALSLIRKPPVELPKDHKQRGKQIAEALQDGSLYTMVKLIRDLHGRKKIAGLNQTEIALLEKITRRFLKEWSIVKGEDDAVLVQKLEEALQTSVQKTDDGEDITWLEKVKKEVKGRKKQKVQTKDA